MSAKASDERCSGPERLLSTAVTGEQGGGRNVCRGMRGGEEVDRGKYRAAVGEG